MAYKLGSLFDGSGGFPLAGSLCGIEPKWAAEVEPYPIAVTRSRFPSMKHLGDISKVNGAEIEPVDIITFGSPCQDLSVAGKRAGLKHEANGDEETTRSGLFMEAVRIIKEMRRATNGEYPTFALWENVPGAFSSNKGEDFRIVCEELIKIIEPSASMPAVPKNGWPYADSYVGDGWSLAYRVFDAQYWGVPQRRRRIHLVLDLRGERARKVLFEREGVRGYFETGRTPWQGLACDAQDCSGTDDRAGESAGDGAGRGLDAVGFLRQLGGVEAQMEVAPTLMAAAGMSGNNKPCVAYSFDSLASNSMKSKNPHSGCRQVEIAKTLDTTDPNPSKNQGGIAIVEPVPYTMKIRSGCEGGGKGALVQEDKSATLATNNDQYLFQPVSIENHPADSRVDIDESGKVQTLTSRMGTGGGNVPMVMEAKPVYCLQGNGIDRADTAGCNGKGWKEDVCYTLNTIDRPAVAYGINGDVAGTLDASYYKGCGMRQGVEREVVAYLASGKETVGTLMANAGTKLWLGNQEAFSGDYHIIESTAVRYIVRRLTPTECARLQGFADRWGDIDEKVSFTPEEFEFWHEVRNTHATVIGGKDAKEYTESQMLAWYNKLHTDSAEYKMWGNGIALPPALYCLQGMADAFEKEEENNWML